MDTEKKEKFQHKFTDILNYGALNLAMAIGYRTRLFDIMHEAQRPLSCADIAGRANLHERYVKEWLGIMCTGKIIDITEYENQVPEYFLPEEHAAFLVRSSDAAMGVYTQEIPLLTDIAMKNVVNDFSKGSGIPFSAYPRFQEFMGELSHEKLRETLIQKFIPGVDDKKLIRRLEDGITVCDLGCGQGVAVNLLARAFPNSSFTGIDNHAQALKNAKKDCTREGLQNAEFLLEDAALIKDKPDLHRRFDYIMAFDAIHDQSHPFDALTGIKHMLKPGGLFSMIDIDAQSDHAGNMDHPMGPFLYTVSMMHCMPVGLCDNGEGLGMMWGRKKALSMLKSAGFKNVEALEMAHDPFNVHYLCRA